MSDNQKLPYIQINEDNVPQFEISWTNYSVFPDVATIEPHRHDYQTIIWTKSGTGQHLIDGQVMQLIPNTFCMIAKGQVHQFVAVDKDFALTSVRFNDAFLPERTFDQIWSYRATLFNNPSTHNQTLPARTDEIVEIESLLQLMEAEYHRTEAVRQDDGLRLLLQFLLMRIARLQQESASELSNVNVADYDLYQNFVTLLENTFHEHHSVNYYADSVNVSASQLSKLTKQMLGKSAKQVILERINLEAKRLLQFSDISVKEIAFALGYNNPYHFSRAFKSYNHSSPNEFRKQNKKMV
jgi:AraC family transcriptional regulator, transcriptional activator of pobA